MSLHRLSWNQPAPPACRGGMVAIGNFDGVHLGHAALVAQLRDQAIVHRVPAVVVTFDPHPLLLLRPEQFQPILTTLEDRSQYLHAAGAAHVIILETRPDLLQLSAEEFFQKVIRENLQARGLVEGPNFGFGRNREGNVETLARLCGKSGMPLEIVKPVEMDGGIVSSNRIRRALTAGDIASANRWLGRPYQLSGEVGVGQRRGQQLGFPTANLQNIPTLIPGDGVYAVRAWVENQSWPAAANVGPNPTFGEQARKVEVHLIGLQGDLYGQSIKIEFLAKLRETRAFDSVNELLSQIRKDTQKAQQVVGG